MRRGARGTSHLPPSPALPGCRQARRRRGSPRGSFTVVCAEGGRAAPTRGPRYAAPAALPRLGVCAALSRSTASPRPGGRPHRRYAPRPWPPRSRWPLSGPRRAACRAALRRFGPPFSLPLPILLAPTARAALSPLLAASSLCSPGPWGLCPRPRGRPPFFSGRCVAFRRPSSTAALFGPPPLWVGAKATTLRGRLRRPVSEKRVGRASPLLVAALPRRARPSPPNLFLRRGLRRTVGSALGPRPPQRKFVWRRLTPASSGRRKAAHSLRWARRCARRRRVPARRLSPRGAPVPSSGGPPLRYGRGRRRGYGTAVAAFGRPFFSATRGHVSRPSPRLTARKSARQCGQLRRKPVGWRNLFRRYAPLSVPLASLHALYAISLQRRYAPLMACCFRRFAPTQHALPRVLCVALRAPHGLFTWPAPRCRPLTPSVSKKNHLAHQGARLSLGSRSRFFFEPSVGRSMPKAGAHKNSPRYARSPIGR